MGVHNFVKTFPIIHVHASVELSVGKKKCPEYMVYTIKTARISALK